VVDRVPKLGTLAAYARQKVRDLLIDHREYIEQRGEDMPAIRDWRWPGTSDRDERPDRRERGRAPIEPE
jgi:xylulose-5-phosphate/fructose-6-phosphate phosphoketolase